MHIRANANFVTDWHQEADSVQQIDPVDDFRCAPQLCQQRHNNVEGMDAMNFARAEFVLYKI
jgi:hypothetical protein